jgi:hypothetical protein
MPEKYQKNMNSQTMPAQSNLFGVVVLRSVVAIKRSAIDFSGG